MIKDPLPILFHEITQECHYGGPCAQRRVVVLAPAGGDFSHDDPGLVPVRTRAQGSSHACNRGKRMRTNYYVKRCHHHQLWTYWF
jgi:hypothetical protein